MGVFSSKLSAAQMGILCHELGTAYTAGIPIVRSLKLVAGATDSRPRGAKRTSMPRGEAFTRHV